MIAYIPIISLLSSTRRCQNRCYFPIIRKRAVGDEYSALLPSVNKVYVIENADSSITSLQPGETFAYEYGEGDVLIVKLIQFQSMELL